MLDDRRARGDRAQHYNEVNFGQLASRGLAGRARAGTGRAHPARRGARTRTASAIVALAQGEPCVACIEVEFLEAGRRPAVRDHLPQRGAAHDLRRHSAGTGRRRAASRRASGRRSGSRFENWLAPSRYTLTPAVGVWDPELPAARPARGPRLPDRRGRRPHRRRGRPPDPARGRALVSAQPPRAGYRAPSALGDDLRRFVSLTCDARRSPTSSCASSARRSATSGR